MSLHDLLGQSIAQTTLRRALSAKKVHHAYRFEGPPGVGKETAALLLAQALLCERPSADGGCGECSACKRAVHFSDEAPRVPQHPDLILIGRGVYPPHLIGGATEASGISVEQVRRLVASRLGYPPHEGRALVVVIRAADELTISAGNALLKTLEEPADKTHFILITSRPMKLLDTIRSRTLAIRFGALDEQSLSTLLQREGLPLDVLPYAQGSLERARELASEEVRQSRDLFVRRLDEALANGHPAAALSFADTRPDARGELVAMLAFAATTLAHRAREENVGGRSADLHLEVMQAIRHVESNGSPALVLESMVTRMLQLA